MLIDIAGMKANISTLTTAPKAFVAEAPEEFTKVDTNMLLMEIRDCWTIDGGPILKSRKVMCVSNMSFLGLKATKWPLRLR
jgi:hypothetical protein